MTIKFSQLTAGGTIGGTEIIPMVQAGVNYRTTPSAIRTYVLTQSQSIFGVAPTAAFRSDTQIEVQAATSPGISLFSSAATGGTTQEEFIAYGAKDAGGNTFKQASISAKWASATSNAGQGVLRFNAAGALAGVTTDDVALRLFFQHGVDVFGSSDTTGPGASVLRINGEVRALTQIGVNGASAVNTTGILLGTSSVLQRGIDAQITGVAAANYAVIAGASGAGTVNYALYASAGGAGTNYGLYVNAGDTYLAGKFSCNAATPQAASTGYGTPINGAKQASFDATSITLVNLAKATAQLIIDLKAVGLLAA